MNAKGIMLITTLGVVLVAVPFLVRAQQPDLDRQVQEAIDLYRDGNFAEAIVKLQDVISRLKLLRDIDAKRMQLADAYLHMTLSYFALDNRAAAKENLKGFVRLDRERRLDPQIYAPPVIELFEEARAEVLLEPVTPTATTPTATPSVRPSPSAAPKKGGSKVPLIVAGAAAGATAAGVALGKGGGSSSTPSGGSSGTTPSGGSPTVTTTTTTTTIPPSGNFILVLGFSPPAGSTITAVAGGTVATVSVSVQYSETGFYSMNLRDIHEGQVGFGSCLSSDTPISLKAGEAQTVSLRAPYQPTFEEHCSLPRTIIALIVDLRPIPYGNQLIPAQTFRVDYRLVP